MIPIVIPAMMNLANHSPIIHYLSQSNTFIEKLMKGKVYIAFQQLLDMEIVKLFYRVKQTYDFMRFMMDNGSNQQIIEYLENLNEIETQDGYFEME